MVRQCVDMVTHGGLARYREIRLDMERIRLDKTRWREG